MQVHHFVIIEVKNHTLFIYYVIFTPQRYKEYFNSARILRTFYTSNCFFPAFGITSTTNPVTSYRLVGFVVEVGLRSYVVEILHLVVLIIHEVVLRFCLHEAHAFGQLTV